MKQPSPHTIILVDDHPIVRKGVAALLEMEGRWHVVAEAENGEQLLKLLESIQADAILLDLSMPRLSGIETARRISRQSSPAKILVLSMYDDEAFVQQAMEAGVDGYILKQSMEDELFEALHCVLAGETYLSPSVSLSGQAVEEGSGPSNQLTSREREILQLIVEGHNTSEIAEMLKISPHTASRHRANLMQKLESHTQAGLVRTAIEQGLVILKKPPHGS